MRLRSQDSTPLTFTLKSRSKHLRLSATHITATPDETQHELSKRVAGIAGLSLDRLRATFENSNKPLDKRTHRDSPPTVGDIPDDESVLVIKDLGPQISWRLTFVIEYIGPLVIHVLLYLFPQVFYGTAFKHSFMQTLTLLMVVLHFVKRELETLFVHRFSADTMPLAYIFRNSGHYWLLSGLVFGYVVYQPGYYANVQRTPTRTLITIILYLFAELSNLQTHITLRRLRPEGSRARPIPHGYGFDWPFGGISLPNYFFEILAWVVIGVWSECWAILPFILTAVWIMDRWAQQKHRKYKKEFPNYPKRAAIFPFVR